MEDLHQVNNDSNKTEKKVFKICFDCKEQITHKPFRAYNKDFCDVTCKLRHDSSCECYL